MHALWAMVLSWWCVAAGAEDPALHLERARAALAEDRAQEALDLAIAAVQADPSQWSAHRMYLSASERGGLLVQAEAELAELRTTDPVAGMVWAWWRVRRGELPLVELERAAARVPGDGSTALAWVAAAHRGAEAARELLPADTDDPSTAWLALRLDLLEARDREAARRARRWRRERPDRPEVLEELWTRREGQVVRPLRRARAHSVRHVLRELPRRWEDPLYLYRALRVLIASGRTEEARAVAARLEGLGAGEPLHRGPWGRAMREAMGRTLALSRSPELPRGSREELTDIVEALERHALGRGQPEVALVGREALAERVGDVASLTALAALQLEIGRPQQALASADDALRAAAAPAFDDLARLDIARQAAEVVAALQARTRALEALGRRAEAERNAERAAAVERPGGAEEPPPHPDPLIQGVLGSLVRPLDAARWERRAQALEEAGHLRAAFAAWAVVAHLGGQVGDALERTYRGLAAPRPVASALAARWADGMEDHAARLQALGTSATPPDRAPRPRVGRPMPRWEAVDLEGARVASADLEGTVYVLALWASWCGPCRLELPELHAAVSGVAAEGLAVAGLAVSVDERERAWRRAHARGGWERLRAAWAPGLAEQLRVPELPATFVVAADGTLVHHQVGYDPDFPPKLTELLQRHAR